MQSMVFFWQPGSYSESGFKGKRGALGQRCIYRGDNAVKINIHEVGNDNTFNAGFGLLVAVLVLYLYLKKG